MAILDHILLNGKERNSATSGENAKFHFAITQKLKKIRKKFQLQWESIAQSYQISKNEVNSRGEGFQFS